MSKTSLQSFTERTIAKGRIGFGDVRRLQRDILPDGIGSREEADLLIALDRDIVRQDPAWIDWLVGALVDYVVWGERPAGYVDADKAVWITSVLDGGGKATRNARLIAREIVKEAQSSHETLVAFSVGGPDVEIEPADTEATGVHSKSYPLQWTATPDA